MQTMVVTGGAGFIGANFIRYALAKTDAKLVIVDKLTYAGNLASLEEALKDPRVQFVEGDIANQNIVQSVFLEHQPTAVVNFAAESHVDRSIDDPSPFIETNITGTFVLLEASRKHIAKLSEAEQRAFRFLHV